MIELHLKFKKNRTIDRWRRLGSEILQNNVILTCNHGFRQLVFRRNYVLCRF